MEDIGAGDREEWRHLLSLFWPKKGLQKKFLVTRHWEQHVTKCTYEVTGIVQENGSNG